MRLVPHGTPCLVRWNFDFRPQVQAKLAGTALRRFVEATDPVSAADPEEAQPKELAAYPKSWVV